MAEYSKIKDTTLSAFFSKLKAFFWHKTDVVNVPLATVATTGDYNDLINKPGGGGTPTTWQAIFDSDDLGNPAFIVEIPVDEEESSAFSIGDLVECSIPGDFYNYEFTTEIVFLLTQGDPTGAGAVIVPSLGGGGGTTQVISGGVYPVEFRVVWE